MIFYSKNLAIILFSLTFAQILNLKIMEATERIQTSFRLQSGLLEELKAQAKASNRSLNNYVESLLISILHPSTVKDDNVITPELRKKIDKGMEEYRNGETLNFENATDMNKWLDSL